MYCKIQDIGHFYRLIDTKPEKPSQDHRFGLQFARP